LVTPPEEITDEVRDEHDVHLLLFTGTAVVGPATTNTVGPLTQAYTDVDSHGFPVGLTDAITARTGTGTLTVTLRHMPPEEPRELRAPLPARAGSSRGSFRLRSRDALVRGAGGDRRGLQSERRCPGAADRGRRACARRSRHGRLDHRLGAVPGRARRRR